MSENLSLGKKGQYGEIDFSKIRSGIKKDELLKDVDKKLKPVFEQILNKIDSNPNDNMLSRSELEAFFAEVKNLAGEDNALSKREGRKYELDGEKIGRKGRDALYALLNKLSALSEDVKEITKDKTNPDVEIIEYKNGKIEKVFPDGSRIITVKNGGKTISTTRDKDDVKTEESVTEGDETVTTTYKDNKKTQEVITSSKHSGITTIKYDAEEKPISQVCKKEDGSIEEYEYIDDGNTRSPRLVKTVKDGNTTVYNYDENGIKTGETVTTSDGKNIERTYNEDGKTEVITQNGQPTHTKKYDSDGNYSDSYSEDNTDVTDSYDNQDRHIEQTKVRNGQTYNVRYDENGNTLGIIVQNGETIEDIANKFGVNVKDLIKANAGKVRGKYPNAYFNVGEEIKIPRKLAADDAALQGRQTKEEAIAAYNEDAQRRAEEARQRAEAEANKPQVVAKGNNGYYVTKDKDGNIRYYDSKGKEISGAEFKKHCPSIYDSVQGIKTRKKYDTATIQKQADELAEALHSQISGASTNSKTIGLLKTITYENVAFVVASYQSKYGVSLAKDIDDEWGLDINTVKEHICKKLAAQAKALGVTGIYFGDYQKINDIDTLNNWINNAAAKIRNAMNNATEKYKAGDANDVSPEQKSVQRSSAAQIVADIEKAISGWNDIDALKRAISRIDKPEELKEVNRLLALKGYNTDEKYSPIEKLIYEEANHSAVHTYNSSDYLEQVVQKWISNGTLTGQEANKAQARMAARVIFDGGDGFGTDCEKIKKGVRMIKCPKPTGNREKDNAQAREVYKLVNQILVNHRTFYGLGSPSKNLLDYCKGEMWDSEVKYLNGILAETNAIQGEEKAQAVKDLTQEAVEGAGTDIEYLEQAIRAIDSPADRKAVEAKLKVYCEKKGIKPQIAGQSYLQAILYDECDTFMGISTDHKEIRKFNEMLIKQGAYTEQEIINLRAEQAALQILEGDFSNIQDAVQQIKDKRVYSKVLELLKTKHQAGFDDFLTKKLGQEKSDLVYAELAANTILGGTKTVEVVFRLIQSPDFNVRAKGIMAIRTSEVANMVDELLKKKGSSLAKVLEQFNKEKAEYRSKAEFWNGLGKFLIGAPLAETISDAYKENTDSSDNMYVETKQVQNIPEDKKAAYQMTVQVFEQKLEQMKQDYQKALDSQGVVSGALNAFCEAYGIGTTREEIAARIEHDTETLRLLKLAADGKLAKIENGKEVAVSFEAVFKERNVGINFDAEKVENVANQAQRLACMEYAKDNITACWDELSTARTEQQYASAIIDTLEKLSNMSGKKLSLEGLGYSYKNGVIVDKSGKPVPAAKLQEVVNQLKQGLADVSKAMLGVDIPLNSNSSKVSEMLSDGYESKVEGFKKEYRDAFGVDAPDSMIEDYISTIETGKTVLNIGVMIGAIIAAPFTGGGSLAVFAMTAGASLGLNALENSTDADGWTNSEWTSDVSQAFWDGALAAVGVKIGQIAETFAKGGSAIVSQNKWLARLPKGKVAEALEKAKDIAYKMQNQAGKIGKGVLEAKKAQLAAKFPNVSTETIEKMSIIIARAEACGFEVSSDTIQSLVQMYCQHGQFDEASFLQALVLSLGANAVGHAMSAKGTESHKTDALDKATSNGAAHPSNVHVGSKKAEVIRAEVDEALNNPNITGEELARIRAEVEALADRDLRRELMAKIDEAQKKLSSPEKAAYDAAKEANTQNAINHIFEKHSILNDSDVRVLSDYIKNTNDINVLNELKDKLRQKELTYGGVTANYRKLYDAIDARVKVLTPKPNVTDEAQKSYVHSMLNSDKGMVKEEFEQLMNYISKIDSEDELSEISRLVNKKKMLGSYKKQLKAAVEAKSAELKAGINENVHAEEPKAEEPKTEEAKADNSAHADGARESGTANNVRDPKTYRFTKDEIEDFANINAKNVKELEEKLKPLGFEREMIGKDGFVVNGNDDILCSFINKNTGVRYVFSVDSGNVLPLRMISTDINTGKNYSTIEFKRDANGNIVETVEKNIENPKQNNSTESQAQEPDNSYSVRDTNGAVIHIDTAGGVPVKAHVGDKVYDIKDGKFTTEDGIEYKVTDDGIERTNSKSDNSAHADGASQSSQKSYAEMNHEELFAEYYRLKMEVTYSPLNNADKAANINKMKEISVLLEQKGFKIEGDRLVKIKSEAPKSDAAEAADTPKSRFSAAELRQKLGEKLYKAYQKAEELIARVRTMADYEKAKAYIQANFNKFSEVMTDLLDRLKAKARSIGLKFKKAIDDVNEARNARRAAGTAMPDWINSFGGKNSDIVCPKGERVKADINSVIRLGNKVDIDLIDLQGKLNAMKDGDSFMIGRTVTGINDIRINNEYISGQHLKIEKINGEIYVTDMSTNGTVLNTTNPNYAAKWSPDMAGQYNNARSWDFNSKCNQYYDELRMADYSYAESVNAGRITDADINPMFAEFEFVTTSPQNGWSWRKPKKLKGRSINVVDRISLNVKADKNCLRELDMLLEKGVYVNSKGEKVKIKVPDAYYKTPQSLDEWGTRHDPITMYFDGKVSKELEDAIAEITAKYARKPCNGKALMNSLEGKPWIAHEAYTPVEDAKKLYDEAMKLNPELAQGIASWVGKDDAWNCSTGMFAAAQRMVDEYKLSLRQSGNSSSFNHAGRANGSNSGYSGARGADTSHGRTNTTMYQFRDMNDLRYRMADKLNLFSERTQNNIINNLRTRGEFRCQKNGVEYQFVMRGNAVKLEEFDIKTKYDIKETKVDEYNKQTTYQIQDQSDIYWALVYKLYLFSNETQSYIMNKLVNGEVAVLRKGGISYEFSIDANGKITVKEFEYLRHTYETGNNRSNESSGSSRADGSSFNASNVAKQERIQLLEDIIARAEDIKKFTDKFASILSDSFKVTDEAGVQELKKTTRLIKAFWHTDIGKGAPDELQQLCDELFNMTDGRYTVMGQSRMGTPDEVNGILHRIRELTNIDALKSELERLKQ